VISLARILTMTGAHDEAAALLDRSLATPGGVTVNELRLDPVWDPLRSHPRFQKLVAKDASAAQ
jgi:hypothetical protein